MGIPESQLETRCNRPDLASSAATYADMKKPLDTNEYRAGKWFEVYLQVSYRNATNVRADSDGDVVVELTSAFDSNTLALPPADRTLFRMAHSDGNYTWSNSGGTTALASESGWSKVDATGNSSIKLARRPRPRSEPTLPSAEPGRSMTRWDCSNPLGASWAGTA